MIIDFHTHTFPKKIVAKTVELLSQKAHMAPSLEGTREGLLCSMEECGIDYAVTFSVATNKEQVKKLNDIAIGLLNEEPRLIPFGSMHPWYEDYGPELTRLKEAGIKGIKIHPVYQECPLSCENFHEIFLKCRELDLVVITHAGFDIGYPGSDLCSVEMGAKVMEEVPGLKLVMAHMGGWKQWKEAGRLLAGSGAYVDTSFSTGFTNPIPGENYYNKEELTLLNKEEFTDLCKKLGCKKVLYGSDSPWTSHKKTLDFIRNLPLDKEDIHNILGLNAKGLLGL